MSRGRGRFGMRFGDMADMCIGAGRGAGYAWRQRGLGGDVGVPGFAFPWGVFAAFAVKFRVRGAVEVPE